MTRQRLKELDRLRDLGFMQCERLVAATKTIPEDLLFARMTGPKGGMAEFDRFARAIRQIMVLEFELRGLFKAPDRDAPRKLRLVKSDRPGFEPPDMEKLFDLGDLSDLDVLDIRTDYRNGPLDQVVADIRQTLGAEPPADDPFAPPPGRAAAPEKGKTVPVQAKVPPATVKLPEKAPSPASCSPAPFTAQKQAAVKSAALAIKATGGNGFRLPSAKPGKRKRPGGRGPPR